MYFTEKVSAPCPGSLFSTSVFPEQTHQNDGAGGIRGAAREQFLVRGRNNGLGAVIPRSQAPRPNCPVQAARAHVSGGNLRIKYN